VNGSNRDWVVEKLIKVYDELDNKNNALITRLETDLLTSKALLHSRGLVQSLLKKEKTIFKC